MKFFVICLICVFSNFSLFAQVENDTIRINTIKKEKLQKTEQLEQQIERARKSGDLFSEMIYTDSLSRHLVTNFGDNKRAYELNRRLEKLIKDNPNEEVIKLIEAEQLKLAGVLLRDQSKHEESLPYFIKSHQIGLRDSVYSFYRDSGGHLGEAYSLMGENEKAIAEFKKAEELAKSLTKNKNDMLARVYEFKTHHFFRKKMLDSALYNVKKSLGLKEGKAYEIAVRNIILGDILFRLNHNIDSAMFYVERGLKIAEYNGLEREEILGHRLIHQLYSKKGDYEKAYHHLHEFYELEQTQRSFEDALQIGNVNLEREKEAAKLQQQLADVRLSNQRLVIWIVSGGLLILILGLLYIFNRLKFIRKQNKVIEQEKFRAEQSERYKEQFLANMSHEIRTPMHAISGMVNALRRRDHGKDQESYLDAMKISSDNLLVILNDVLDMSKIESGSLEIAKIPMNVIEITNNVLNLLTHRAHEKGLTINFKKPRNFPKIVLGDPVRLNQILVNLVGNAIKFTEEGTITVNLTSEVDKIKFAIQDTGIGIPKDSIATIFDSFKQGEEALTKKYAGTGLGLTITKRLITLQDGAIWVDSEPGKGSTFYFELPLVEANETELSNKSLTESQLKEVGESLKGLKLLIAEDNSFNVMVVKDDLSWFIPEIDLTFVENGIDAVKKFKEEHYDMILMDVQMPEMNGYEATKQIRQIESELQRTSTPIVAMTASLLKDQIDKCYKVGMDAYIPKPYKTEDLIETIRNNKKEN